MKKYKTITTALILVFAAIGCEREDLSYDKPDTPDTPTEVEDSAYEEPVVPKDDPAAVTMAGKLHGNWEGTLQSSYIDDYGMTVSGTYTTTVSFKQYEAKSVNGSGREADYKDGKLMWQMAFTWYVASVNSAIPRLMMKRADGYELYSKYCTFDGETLKMELVGTDGLETSIYVLTSSK